MNTTSKKTTVKHKVKRGENLSRISKKYRTTVAELIKKNPNLEQNPNKILAGSEILIPIITANRHVSKITFNGKAVTIEFSSKSLNSVTLKAKSGLPKGSSRIKELINGGRQDIKDNIDYQNSKHQKVNDAGPIPAADYTLKLKKGMRFDKTGKGWGTGGWFLKESLLNRIDDFFGGRNGFFLHEDGGAPGTAGCIGLQKKGEVLKIQKILSDAFEDGQKKVTIRVKY